VGETITADEKKKREIDGVELPEEYFVMPSDAGVGFVLVHPINQQLAEYLTQSEEASATGERALVMESCDGRNLVITLWKIEDETYIIEVDDGDGTVYFEATSDLLKEELSPMLKASEWFLKIVDGKLIDEMVDSL